MVGRVLSDDDVLDNASVLIEGRMIDVSGVRLLRLGSFLGMNDSECCFAPVIKVLRMDVRRFGPLSGELLKIDIGKFGLSSSALLMAVVILSCGGNASQHDVADSNPVADVAGDVAVDVSPDVSRDSGRDSAGDGRDCDHDSDCLVAVDVPDDAGADVLFPDDHGFESYDAGDSNSPDDAPGDGILVPDGKSEDVGDPDAVTPGCTPAGPDAPIVDCDHPVSFAGGMHQTCVVVPAGHCHTFWMGAVPNELYIVPMSKEIPRHQVHLTGFRISRFPVTVAEYRACIQAGVCRQIPADSCLANPMRGDLSRATPNIGDDLKISHPVNCVSYSDAADFCGWLGGEIPTEARFEYASAGPMTDDQQIVYFPWGSNLDSEDGHIPDYAECHANILGKTTYADPFPETSPVGFFDGSLRARAVGGWVGGPDTYQTCNDTGPFGTRDMTHNVLEFMKDGPSMYDDWAPGMVDPDVPAKCVGVTVRNTSWRFEDMVHARVTNRHFICLAEGSLPDGVPFSRNVIRSNDIGFRCAFTDN